ncbi:flagellar basal body-associated FliL family protein [Crenalkalicoccus roseus]|uniref:flagellar basal body-associated FliL family protein n=1 Tax=Crenalkalicoccus roseus TaxID=1485588 RepID=UPI001080FAA6|nr:flagellar basal body-associated FliL family protein [Crenalkalicoccus roseus]
MAEAEAKQAKGKGGGRRRLVLFVLPPLLLAGAGAGGWAMGLFGGGKPAAAPAPRQPVFLEMPEIIANLNTGGRRASYIKLRSKLELAGAEDAAAVQAAMPRLVDLFTTYLREVRPEELRGSAGTYRLREELVARANVAVPPPAGRGEAPARITDVLFLEILQQ